MRVFRLPVLALSLELLLMDHAQAQSPLGYSLQAAPAQADAAQEHANKQLFLEVARQMFVERDLGAIDRHYAEDYVNHDPERQARARAAGLTDRQATRAFFEHFLAAFPDVKLSVDQLYAEGDRVIALTSWRGTHKAPFFGMPPSGRPILIRTVEVFRIVDGKFQDHWDVVDQSGLMPPRGPQGQ